MSGLVALHEYQAIEKELDVLVTRVNFCEGCYASLKKDVPKYLAKTSELHKASKSLAITFKNIASTEANLPLQTLLFKLAEKCEILDGELETYKKNSDDIHTMIDNLKKEMTQPLRDILLDGQNTVAIAKKVNALMIKNKNSGVNDKESQLLPDRIQMLNTTLPIHNQLFEAHRSQRVRDILQGLVYTELTYHLRVIEELSPILEMIRNP